MRFPRSILAGLLAPALVLALVLGACAAPGPQAAAATWDASRWDAAVWR